MSAGLRSRRHFLQHALALTSAGLVAGCGLTPPLTRQTAKPRRAGLLGVGNPGPPPPGTRSEFVEAMRELGWIEDQNVIFDRRRSQREEDMPALATELAGMPVDVIVAENTGSAVAAKTATTAIPVVMVAVADAERLGLIESLAHPGGNITGLANANTEIFPRRLQILKAAVPGASRVGVLVHPAWPAADNVRQALIAAAPSMGVQLHVIEIHDPADYEPAFAEMTRDRVDAVNLLADPMAQNNAARLAELAARYRLPAIGANRPFTAAGGLLAEQVDFDDLFRRAAGYADKLLRGAKPADLPVQRPQRYFLYLNVRTAQALRLTIPDAVFAQVTEAIE